MNRIDTNVDSLTARRTPILNHAGVNQAIERLCSTPRAPGGEVHRTGQLVGEGTRDSHRPVAAATDQETGTGGPIDGPHDVIREVSRENVRAAEITKHDADFVRRTSAVSRAQILASSILPLSPATAPQPPNNLALRV